MATIHGTLVNIKSIAKIKGLPAQKCQNVVFKLDLLNTTTGNKTNHKSQTNLKTIFVVKSCNEKQKHVDV